MKKAQSGVNDLATLYPDIAVEWDSTKNNGLSADSVFAHSGIKAYWLCPHGHSYIAKVAMRTADSRKGTGCPYCSGKKAIPGVNDVGTSCPDAIKDWDYQKNTIQPSELLVHSEKKVWWKCDKGHSYEMMLCRKTQKKPYGCPICSGNQLLVGFNDLKTLFPEAAEEWDYEKNPTRPEDHIAGTHVKAWWICKQCGKHFRMTIKDHTYGNERCPNCTFYYKTSLPEQCVYFYVKKYFQDAINSYKPHFLNGMEIDIFIPSLNLGIEYDGASWHKTRQKKESDNRKSSTIRENGISLIRIKEQDDINEYGDLAVIKSEYNENLTTMKSAITQLFTLINDYYNLNIFPNIDLMRDYDDINKSVAGIKCGKSLAESGSKALKEWAYDLNKNITPDKVTPGSHKKAWWRCEICGAEWQQTIKTKVNGQEHCPNCRRKEAGTKRIENWIASGKDTVADYPDLVAQWIDKKNPKEVLAGSMYEAKWKCPRCENEYFMPVKNRIGQHQACPKCRGYRISASKKKQAITL